MIYDESGAAIMLSYNNSFDYFHGFSRVFRTCRANFSRNRCHSVTCRAIPYVTIMILSEKACTRARLA